MSDNLQELTKCFARDVIARAERLPRTRTAAVLGRQRLRSGTSVGANYRAACRARSRAEFIAKFGMVEEEADETRYRRELLVDVGMVEPADVMPLLMRSESILGRVIASIRASRPHRDSAPRTPHPAREKGQALVELAVFGSMMIVVLGSLVAFAMNFDRQQETQMAATRDAMSLAARDRLDNYPEGETVVRIDDGIIPDPTNPFGMGSSTSASFSASTPPRHFKTGRMPSKQIWAMKRELPRTIIKVNGEAINCASAIPASGILGCTSAGIWNVPGVWGFKWVADEDELVNNPDAVGPIDKIDLVFGISNTRVMKNTRWCPNGNNDNCRATMQILDSSGGEIVTRNGALYTCRQLFDAEACYRECLRTTKHPEKFKDPLGERHARCDNTCSQQLPRTPIYCDKDNAPTYLSANFEQLFHGIREMGLQPGSNRVHEADTTFIRRETAAGTTTTSRIDRWRDQATRSVVFHDKGGNPFVVMGTQGRVSRPQNSKDVTNEAVIWETPN